MPAGSTGHRSKSRWPNPGVAVASLVIATATVLPLLFWIGTEEAFALPKLLGMTVSSVAGLAIVGRLVTRGSLDSGRWLTPPDWLVAAFFVLLAASFWQSIDHGQSFLGERFQRQGFLAMTAYVVSYALARFAISDQVRLRLLVRSAAVAGTAAAIYGLMQWAGFDPIWSKIPLDRVFSTIGQSNALGAFLAMSIPLTAAITPDGTQQRVVKAIAIITQVAALLLTFSRGAYLGLTAGVVIVGIVAVSGWSRRQWRIAPIVAVVTLLLVAGFTATSPLRAEVNRAGTRLMAGFDTEDASVRARLDFWKVGLAMSADRPFIGSGPDTYVLLFPEYRDRVLTPERAATYFPYRVESPHNVYLAISTGSGIPAAIVYLALVGTVLWMAGWTAWRNADQRVALLIGGVVAALAAHTITDFFMTGELAGSWLVWALLGALAAVMARGEDRAEVTRSVLD